MKMHGRIRRMLELVLPANCSVLLFVFTLSSCFIALVSHNYN
jgi:hypothetical protein